ncbi:MAG: acetyltransferase [Colwellia sp.]|jgi:sugar O-acyltransferase, sialic acid O-acetyltransferase NeuD family
MPTKLAIIGAGGHAKVVLDTLIEQDQAEVLLYDSSQELDGSQLLDCRINLLGNLLLEDYFHIAIGSNHVRLKFYEKFKNDSTFLKIESTSAIVSHFANIGVGVYIAAGSVIGCETEIGLGSIINHGAVVDHDCKIGRFCHIAPNATLLGNVEIGEQVFIGAGSIVLPGVFIASHTIIGAGAVVTSDVLEAGTIVGVPGRRV